MIISLLKELLGCDTLDGCRQIQKGNIFFKRLGKLSILFSLAVTLIVNDMIAAGIDIVTGQYQAAKAQYDKATSSVLYRWTVGWLVPAHPMPQMDNRLIKIYKALNATQLCLFIATIVWCLRWVYADCQVRGSSFGSLLFWAVITNLLIYFILRKLVFAILNLPANSIS